MFTCSKGWVSTTWTKSFRYFSLVCGAKEMCWNQQNYNSCIDANVLLQISFCLLSFNFQSRTIREFDDRFTSKQFGYPTYKEYYEDACIHRKVSDIKIPLLCLNAADDPFSPAHGRHFSWHKLRCSPYVQPERRVLGCAAESCWRPVEDTLHCHSEKNTHGT